MTFEEFKTNVQQWAQERGIYEHSTPEAQLLKALSELGELADAVIKDDIDGIKDAIGDVAVCIVNYSFMSGGEMDEIHAYPSIPDHDHIGFAAELIGGSLQGMDMPYCISELDAVAQNNDLDFMACCEHAWNEIKDRKGRMVPGGAFVKDD